MRSQDIRDHVVMGRVLVVSALISVVASIATQNITPALATCGVFILANGTSRMREFWNNHQNIKNKKIWVETCSMVDKYPKIPFHSIKWIEDNDIPSVLYIMEWSVDAAEYHISFDNPNDAALFEVKYPGALISNEAIGISYPA